MVSTQSWTVSSETEITGEKDRFNMSQNCDSEIPVLQRMNISYTRPSSFSFSFTCHGFLVSRSLPIT